MTMDLFKLIHMYWYRPMIFPFSLYIYFY